MYPWFMVLSIGESSIVAAYTYMRAYVPSYLFHNRKQFLDSMLHVRVHGRGHLPVLQHMFALHLGCFCVCANRICPVRARIPSAHSVPDAALAACARRLDKTRQRNATTGRTTWPNSSFYAWHTRFLPRQLPPCESTSARAASRRLERRRAPWIPGSGGPLT